MKFVVEIADLRLALKSVTPHAGPKDFVVRHRVRIDVGGENVTVSATNGYTAALGLVSLWDNDDGEVGCFDLSPSDATEILALFHGNAGADGEPGDSVRIEVNEKQLSITDISGLFAGKSLTLPRYQDEDNFSDIAALIRTKLEQSRNVTSRLVTSSALLKLFTIAAAAYKEPLVIDPSGSDSAMLISCGDSFIGLLQPQRLDDKKTAEINGWHLDWVARLSGGDE